MLDRRLMKDNKHYIWLPTNTIQTPDEGCKQCICAVPSKQRKKKTNPYMLIQLVTIYVLKFSVL